MTRLENLYGIKSNKKNKMASVEQKSISYKTKRKSEKLVLNASILYTKGKHDQALSLLEESIKLFPYNAKAFHLAGLIHEECGNAEKSLNAYFLSASLSKGCFEEKTTKYLWKKVYEIADFCSDNTKLIGAINKINRKGLNKELVEKKLQILQKTNAHVLKTVCCEIDLMRFRGINYEVFKKLDDYTNKAKLHKVSRHLKRLIKKTPSAHEELFLEKSLEICYKADAFDEFIYLFDEFYISISHYPKENVCFMRYLMVGKKHFRSKSQNYIEKFQFVSFHKKILNEPFHLIENKLVTDLCNFYVQTDRLEMCIELLEEVLKYNKSEDTKVFYGNILIKVKSYDKAACVFTDLLKTDKTSVEYKCKLFEIYENQGNLNLANQYKFSDDLEKHKTYDKGSFYFNNEQCCKIRNIYESLFKNKPDSTIVEFLLEDFFSNKFVQNETGKFTSFFERNKKYNEYEKIGQEIVVVNEIVSKREKVSKYVELSCLHGLSIKEWRKVLFYAMSFYLQKLENNPTKQNIEEFYLVIRRMCKVRFWDSQITEFDLVYLKVCLIYQNQDVFCDCLKIFLQKTNYSVFNLHYFLMRFLKDITSNENFVKIAKTVQRFYVLRFEKRQEIELDNTQNELTVNCNNDFIKSTSNLLFYETLSKSELTYEEKEAMYTETIFLNSYFPRYVYNTTIKKVKNTTRTNTYEERMLLGLLYLNNSKSRSLSDKLENLHIARDLILEASEMDDLDESIKNYNLAKFYYYTGNLVEAEKYFLNCADLKNNDVKKLALFNLSLICQKNKSRSFRKILARRWKD